MWSYVLIAMQQQGRPFKGEVQCVVKELFNSPRLFSCEKVTLPKLLLPKLGVVGYEYL